MRSAVGNVLIKGGYINKSVKHYSETFVGSGGMFLYYMKVLYTGLCAVLWLTRLFLP